MQSLRDQINSKRDFRQRKVDCPEWGFPVWVRSLGAADFAIVADELGLFDGDAEKKDRSLGNYLFEKGRLFWILVRTICDSQGNLAYSPEEEDALKDKNLDVLMRLATEAILASVGEMREGVEGNSQGAPSGASSCDSAPTSTSSTPTILTSLPGSSGTGSPSPPSSPSGRNGPTCATPSSAPSSPMR